MKKYINLLHNLENLPKPKAILLDWDNTFADSWKIIHKCLNVAFREMGHPEWKLEEVIQGREGIHHSLRESFPRLFGDKWEQARQYYYNAFIACHLQEISLLPGALETIKGLSETGAFVAIVSNKTGGPLRKELAHLQIDQYFHKAVGATDAEKDKPYPEPLLFALKDVGIGANDFDKVWMVGDSITDIEAAFNTGVVPVLFGHADVDSAVHKGKIYQIESQTEFHMVAKKLRG